MVIEKILITIVTAVFINNIIFSKIIGLTIFFEESKKIKNAVYIGLITTINLVISSGIIWYVDKNILKKLNMDSLDLMIYVLIIVCVSYITYRLTKNIGNFHIRGHVGLVVNSAVLGVILMNLENDLSFSGNLISSFFSGIGYFLALLIISGINERLNETKVPKFFRGEPLALITMGIIAMIFMGFFGIKG